ncbi:hypothetical protein BBJ29_005113 [Phytophthora kernoviae]|uniref:SAM domain-containing protein n=1 Tax=Phytophthora kernoviae TaxID=325452 RepID=A0A3R7JL14_9STRA|nr:hypothetical protein BBJ29_005113 [Phytophthora kernoviae]
MAATSTRLEEVKALAKTKRDQQVRQNKSRRRLGAANSLAMPSLADMDARDDYVHGVFQMDSETAIPFCVMGGAWMSTNKTDATDSSEAFFNLVVLAQFLHDTAKVLACTPESRPDLPVYFHARFLFSAAYLARVSTPLALNLYTAVLNPITLEGRQALVLGALAHQDLRADLKRLRVPLISICSTQNAMLDAGAHAETILSMANLELVNSVGKTLQYRRKNSAQQHSEKRGKRPSCVIWLAGGHEALQELKEYMGWRVRRNQKRLQRMGSMARVIQRAFRAFYARTLAHRLHRERCAINLQRLWRARIARKRYKGLKREDWASQGLTFGKQLLLEYKVFGTKLQSDVALLAREKSDVEAQAEKLVKEICEFDEGVRLLEAELLSLGQAEADSNAPGGAIRTLDETEKWVLREQKMRLDREFSQMLAQIAQRREKLATLEEALARVDQERLKKEEELKALERKLVLLLEEQQKELTRIREKQETFLPSTNSPVLRAVGSSPVASSHTSLNPSSSALASSAPQQSQGYSRQQREEAASLMESTETMMKFGFMSMSMTYFSSMNMVRAMRKIGAHHLTLDSAAAVSQQRWPENSAAETPLKSAGGIVSMNPAAFQASIPLGGFPGQQPLQVTAWSVSDVGRWLDTLALAQYKRAFADATVDGALLLHLTDDDLRHTLGMEHRLHRKKVLTTVEEMRVRERDQIRRLYGDNTGGLGGAPVIPEAVMVPNNSPVKQSALSVVNPIPIPASASSGGPPQAPKEPPAGGGRVVVPFSEICSLVRHGKVKQLREALQDLTERRFDPLTIMTQFASGTGTIYSDQLEKSTFHINKSDDNGNSSLLMAAQNNHLKVAQLLLSKGANPDHQNSHGHTAGHYAMAYSFFDLGAWLLDPDKGGGRDDLLNENGLTAYDGLN